MTSKIDRGPWAQVIATGTFRRHLMPFMDYGAKFHESTREGARLVVSFINEVSGVIEVDALAECMGVSAWDFNTHAIQPEKVHIAELCLLMEDEDLAERFTALRDAGFQFYFRLLPPS
ncbi:MAG: hypothetical protein EOO71_10045 [Myxococcaceae bacterium]|nr:MAG: hypothetical protein EOO71_10045 [Myxococcaceae bacterium]